MTIGNIYIEFHKTTTLGHPWGVIGGPWECRVRSFGALGASRGLFGAVLRGRLDSPVDAHAGAASNSIGLVHVI